MKIHEYQAKETLKKFKDSNTLLFESISERGYNDLRLENLEKTIINLNLQK